MKLSLLDPWLAHPDALLLLGAMPVLALLSMLAAWRRRQRLAQWGTLDGPPAPRSWDRLFRGLARGAALILLILGIAGPQWGRDRALATVSGRDLVVLLDVSRSMLTDDVLGRAAPNRLGRAEDGLRNLADAVQRRGGHRLGLVVFAARARVLCPLTPDYDHFRETVARLDPADLYPDVGPISEDTPSGTRIGAGLRAAVEAQDPRFRGFQQILLLSDGDDPAHDGEWQTGSDAARRAGLRVDTVGIGNPDVASLIPGPERGELRYQGQPVRSRLDEAPLREIARQTGGQYLAARTDPFSLGDLFRERIDPLPGVERADDPLVIYQQHAAWFFAPALALLALDMGLFGLLRRQRRARAEPVTAALALGFLGLFVPSAAEQAERLVVEGNTAFERGEYAAALDHYLAAEPSTTDPGLVAFNEAAALYRLGRFREAQRHYERCRDEAVGQRRGQILYNLGNCLVQQGQDQDVALLEQAVACYEACLHSDGISADIAADARVNLQVARDLLARVRARPREHDPSNPNPDDVPRPPENLNDPSRATPQERSGDPGRRPDPRSVGQPQGDGQTESSDAVPRLGVGNLPPIPDRDELAPLSPEDTEAYLQTVARRVAKERQARRHGHVPSLRKVKDW